jgi:DNA-directed RNA polymerase specialized sigma24 family protein
VLLIPPERTILDQIAYRQLTGLIRTVLPEEEFQILREIAEGHSYADIARVRNMTVSSLKSKAFRVREKVRNSRVWSTLHCGLRR